MGPVVMEIDYILLLKSDDKRRYSTGP